MKFFRMNTMSRILNFLLCWWLCFGCHQWVWGQIYVAPSGDDKALGTMNDPFATLTAARDAIRALKRNGQVPKGGIQVWIKGGHYRLDKTFELGLEDSGSRKAPIRYSAMEGEEVFLSGGKSIDSKSAKKVSDPSILKRLPQNAQEHVFVLDLPDHGITTYGQLYQHGFSLPIHPFPLELYINGKPQHLARWPNNGKVPIGEVIDPGSHPREGDYSNRGGSFHYDYERANRWTEADDIWLQGIFSYGYADDNLKVSSIDYQNKIIKVKQPHIYMIRSSNDSRTSAAHLRGYFVYNLLEEIDSPGEYFLDRRTGKLYFWPPTEIGECEVAVSLLDDPLVSMENVSHVELSGFILELSRGMGIYLEGGQSNLISGCVFRNLGLIGIMMGKGISGPEGPVHELTGEPITRKIGSLKAHTYLNSVWDRDAGENHLIENCQFYQLGAGAMILDGGNRKKLYPGNNEVLNCEFYDFNRWNKTYAPAIEIKGVANRIRHNYIHNAPHTVILVSGNEHLIEFNEITEVVHGADDMGAIYMGRDPSEQGTIIRYNFFHHFEHEDRRVAAIYFDDGQNGGRVFGNIFHKVGSPRFGAIFVHGGHDHIFENNIFSECMRGLGNSPWNQERWEDYLKADLWQKRLRIDLDIYDEPYSNRYPQLVTSLQKTDRTNYAHNNVVFRCKTFSVPHYHLSNNWITNEDPGFIDQENLNFGLIQNSAILDSIPDFTPIPFDSIGLRSQDRHNDR